MRKQVDAQFTQALKQGMDKLSMQAGVKLGVATEPGEPVECDEYGFAVRDGGYKAFQRANGASILDQLDDLRLEITELESKMDTLAVTEHCWRKVFDVIHPGDVLTTDDFKFRLHEIGLRLSTKQFTALVHEIDKDDDGAISYDEFIDYFGEATVLSFKAS
eukprot:SAG22_NODE_399_length_11094_cov_5.593452_9_plen_160_part_01